MIPGSTQRNGVAKRRTYLSTFSHPSSRPLHKPRLSPLLTCPSNIRAFCQVMADVSIAKASDKSLSPEECRIVWAAIWPPPDIHVIREVGANGRSARKECIL